MNNFNKQTLFLWVKKGEIALILKKDKKIIDQMVWKDQRDLSEKLLIKLDKLLKRNKIKLRDLDDVKLKADLKESYSTHRIIATTTLGINFCLSLREN